MESRKIVDGVYEDINLNQLTWDEFTTVKSDLIYFVHRVSRGGNATPDEVRALPGVAMVLVGMKPRYC